MTKTNAMHAVFATAAAHMHYNDDLLAEMLELHKQLANGTSRTGVDELVDALNAYYDENNEQNLMQGRDYAQRALEALENDDKHMGMQLLWIACMLRMLACEQAYG